MKPLTCNMADTIMTILSVLNLGESQMDEQCRRLTESINHLLKLSTEWHARRLPEPVDGPHKVTRMQITDLHQLLYSHSNCVLKLA